MKKITIDDLARMVAKGFAQTASKADLNDLENRLTQKIDNMDKRLMTVESLLSSNCIERLEDSMRQVKTILKIK